MEKNGIFIFHVVFSILRRDTYPQNLGPEFEIVVKKPNSKHMSKLFKILDVERTDHK